MAQGAGALPQSELGVAIDGGFRHQLDDGAAAIGCDRSCEERGGLIAAQPPLEKVIAGQGRTFPAFLQLTHISIMTLDGSLRLVKIVWGSRMKQTNTPNPRRPAWESRQPFDINNIKRRCLVRVHQIHCVFWGVFQTVLNVLESTDMRSEERRVGK